MKKNEHGNLLFTDGSSLGNPGPGGWGAIAILKIKNKKLKVDAKDNTRVIEIGGSEKQTTNNRMELTALIEGLRRVIEQGRIHQGLTLNANSQGDTLVDTAPDELMIYLDSAYVHKGATQWSREWVKNNWKTKGKRDIENRDLWETLLALLGEREKLGRVIWKHIPGHSGIAGNERADVIATGFAKGDDVELFEGDLADYTVDILNTTIDKKIAEKRTASRAHSRAKAYSYLSLVGGKVMRHTTWADCEKCVKGKAGAKYKKALSSEDESAILKDWKVRASLSQ
ncbi:MAG: ribonuclease H [Patescibacteria group bacterium]